MEPQVEPLFISTKSSTSSFNTCSSRTCSVPGMQPVAGSTTVTQADTGSAPYSFTGEINEWQQPQNGVLRTTLGKSRGSGAHSRDV